MIWISSGSRPARSAVRRRRPMLSCNASGVPTGKAGLLPMGYQPSHRVAARRMAGRLSPPTQKGGCGFCTGLGRNQMSEKLTYSPSKLGSSEVHNSLNARMYSSVTAPRSSKGSQPTASNSSRHQPTPTPTISLPPDRTSRVARALAATNGLRWGTMSTDVASLMALVHPAM